MPTQSEGISGRNALSSLKGSIAPSGAIERTTKARRRSPETEIPPDFQPTEEHRKYASERGLDVEREVEKFRFHAVANERKVRQWSAAFSQWLTNSEGFSQRRPAGRGSFQPASLMTAAFEVIAMGQTKDEPLQVERTQARSDAA
jgi:hypothetical protein